MSETPMLKPCPFCGAKEETDPANEMGVSLYVRSRSEDWFVHCHGCGAQTQEFGFSKEEATRIWNTRSNDDLIESLTAGNKELVEALELALPRIAHKAACHTTRPSEEWEEHGSASFESCSCERRTITEVLARIGRI